MIIALIAAMTENYVIGKNGELPWCLPSDFLHFKKLTWGKTIVMGRKTFESLGNPLKGRNHVVLSRHWQSPWPDIVVCSTLQKALLRLQHEKEVMVIGGQQIFEEALSVAHRMYLTRIHTILVGDRFFPVWDERDWYITSQEPHQRNSAHAFDYDFIQLDRKTCQ